MENSIKNLYLLTTQGLGQFYVIANDPTQAQNALIDLLGKEDYSFRYKRTIINIQWLAKTMDSCLLQDTRLIIVG